MLITIGMLCFVSLACMAGALSKCYAGTLLQRIGMCLISFWSAWEAVLVFERKAVASEIYLAALGMTIFAAGTIIKTYLWNHRRV